MTTPDTTSTSDLPNFDSLWNYAEPKETERKFRALLPVAEASGDRSYRLQLLTQIARCQGLQQNFDEAHATLDEVEKEVDDDLPIATVRYLLERGRVLNSSGNPEESKPYFLRAWKQGEEAGLDFHAVDAAHMLGIVEPAEEALRWNERAIARAESSEDPRARRWIGALTNNTGWTYHDNGDYETALGLFERNVRWHTEMNTTEGLMIAKWCVARTLRSLGRIEEALQAQRTLAEERIDRGLPPSGYVAEELGECLLATGKAEEATEHFAQAYTLLSNDPWLATNEPERLARLNALGKIGE